MSTPAALDIDGYRSLLDATFDDRVLKWTAEAEATERFPRQLIEHLGRAGVFAQKWTDATQPDVAKLIALAAALGRLMSDGIAVGVSLHDSAIAILRRFGKSDHLRDICERGIRGEAVLCIGASEESGGSDLQIVETEMRARKDGFEVRGVKKYVSLAPIADHIVSPAAPTTIPPAGTATSRWSRFPPARPMCRRPTARSAPDRWTRPQCTSTPGFPLMRSSPVPERVWPQSAGDWHTNASR